MSINKKEILKFLIVGGIATIIDFVVMSVFIYVTCISLFDGFIQVFLSGKQLAPSWVVIIGTGLGFFVSLIFNYFLSCFFVFSNGRKGKPVHKFLSFTLLSLVGLGIHVLGMYIGYDCLGINEWIIKIVLTFVVLVFNYITRKKFVFKG